MHRTSFGREEVKPSDDRKSLQRTRCFINFKNASTEYRSYTFKRFWGTMWSYIHFSENWGGIGPTGSRPFKAFGWQGSFMQSWKHRPGETATMLCDAARTGQSSSQAKAIEKICWCMYISNIYGRYMYLYVSIWFFYTICIYRYTLCLCLYAYIYTDHMSFGLVCFCMIVVILCIYIYTLLYSLRFQNHFVARFRLIRELHYKKV